MQEPLLFYACVFAGLRFRRSAQAHEAARTAVRALLDRHLIGAALLHSVEQRLQALAEAREVILCSLPSLFRKMHWQAL